MLEMKEKIYNLKVSDLNEKQLYRLGLKKFVGNLVSLEDKDEIVEYFIEVVKSLLENFSIIS